MGKSVNDWFAIVLGAVLLIVGILGFTTQSILGLFGVNTLQSVLHVIAGLAIYFGYKGQGRDANKVIGVIALVVGLLWFVVPQLLTSLLYINDNISYLHLVIGVVSLGIAFLVKE